MVTINVPLDLTGVLVAAVHGLAASSVTIHVLLRKRDVRAAIGWIALSWLSPLVGSSLYYIFGINRVTRRASRLSRAIGRSQEEGGLSGAALAAAGLPANIAAIAAVGNRVTGHQLASGNALSLLSGGDDAYPPMLAAIRGARRSIALVTYIFRADAVGHAFIEALTEARSRGVEIRVLVDGI